MQLGEHGTPAAVAGAEAFVDGLHAVSVAKAVRAEPVLVLMRRRGQRRVVTFDVEGAVAVFEVTHENVVVIMRLAGPAHGAQNLVDDHMHTNACKDACTHIHTKPTVQKCTGRT